MNLLYLTFYFEPDIGPGSFRNTALVTELCHQLPPGSHIHVITTLPNRYQSYKPSAPEREAGQIANCRITIERIPLPTHASGFLDQIRAFAIYFRAAHHLTRHQKYALVFASSSRLFTAFLGAKLARSHRIPLFLDIRDLFREAILGVLNNPVIRLGLNPILKAVERYTFRSANHINLVSEGFKPYFNAYPQAALSFFTNGIDDDFLMKSTESEKLITNENRPTVNEVKTIVYAGNIGEGQSLHHIIPEAARQLGSSYRFLIFGDGGAKHKLEKAIQVASITNVEIHQPISRTKLVAIYEQADYLFVHLNDLKACRRVLPSKLFEYGATNKPILAGVAGYAATFVREYLPNTLLFAPGDVAGLVRQMRETPYRLEDRTEFRARFARRTISQAMARQVCSLIASQPNQEKIVLTTTIS